MTEYELIHEIQNLCMNNQMRDIFFEEVECDDPEAYVRGLYPGPGVALCVERGTGGTVTIHGSVDGILHRFVFTPNYFG